MARSVEWRVAREVGMRRRTFIGLLCGAAALPVATRAQQPLAPRRLALVHSGIPADKLTEAAGPFWVRRFYEELRTLGYAEGVNLAVDRFSAEGRTDRFAAVAAAVVNSKPDVIVSNFNALIKMLMKATTTIPIVGLTGEPLSDGLVSNLARPGGNLTGVSIGAGVAMGAKRLQYLKEAVPTAVKVGFLFGSQAEERRSGVSLWSKILSETTELQLRGAFAEMTKQNIDAALVSETGSFLAQRALIVELAAQHHIPMIYPYRDFVEIGGLMAYAPDLGELAKRMASDVHQIFNGTNPGEIPFFLPTKFDLVINLRTAKTLDLTIPSTLLDFCSEVIE
jgi:putative tryptophan/tyrosine transport system substrate-binding protein